MRESRPFAAPLVLTALALLVSALPAARAQRVEAPEHASAHHHHQAGYLGVSVRPLNPDLRRHFGAPAESGVLVASIEPGSPAAAAGLEVGDVLVTIDGVEVRSVATLHREVRSGAGRSVEIEIYRKGATRSLSAQLGERPLEHHGWDTDWDEWAEGWAEWGEQWGEDWAEWGEQFGERWADFGLEMGERWGDRGEEWGEIGSEVGLRLAEAFAEMDWSEMDRALEESIRALEAIDWEGIGEEIEEALEEVDEVLEETLSDLEDLDDPEDDQR